MFRKQIPSSLYIFDVYMLYGEVRVGMDRENGPNTELREEWGMVIPKLFTDKI